MVYELHRSLRPSRHRRDTRNTQVVAAALARHAGLVTLVEAPSWARDLSTPGLASWSVPSAAYGAKREVFARFEDVSNPKKARVAATMFPPADGAPLSLARRFLPSETCDSGGFFVAIFERSAERRPPAAPRATVPLPPEAPPAPPDKEGDWRCACGTNNFARRGRCFSCKRRRPRVVTGPAPRPPPLLARFSGDTSILDAFCDAYGLSAATGFPVESAFLLKRPKRSLLVIASAALADLAISETWSAAADVGCALCEITDDDASRWPLFDEGLDVLARCASRRRVALSPDRLLAILNGGVLSDFGGDGNYVVTSSLAVGAATGRVALGASVADGVVSLSSSARLCEAVRCVVGAFL